MAANITLFWQKNTYSRLEGGCCIAVILVLGVLRILGHGASSRLISGRGALTRGWFCSFPRCWKAMGQGASKTCKRGGRPCCWSCCYLGVVCGWALLLGCLNCHPSGLWNHIISPVKAPVHQQWLLIQRGFTWNVARPITTKEVNKEPPLGFSTNSVSLVVPKFYQVLKKVMQKDHFGIQF